MGGLNLKRSTFDGRGRQAILDDLPDRYDLIVIGAGINGCGIALEAAGRGYSVLLLEQGDIGSGTSSRSSRLVHGGLRYLRDGKVRLVREACRERDWLLSQFPHLVKPLRFLIPFYRGEGRHWVTRIGLWFYDYLSGYTNVAKHRTVTARKVVAAEPRLRREELIGGAFYYDAWTDDFRLVLLNAKRAHAAGAHVLTYARAEEIIMDAGRAKGVAFRDMLGDLLYEVRSDVVVNATGPWSDGIRQMLGRSPRLRPTKGVHLLLPRAQVGNMNAVVMRSPGDGRFVFAIPWRDLTLVGTTDTDHRGSPEDVHADSEDVAYLLDALNRTFPLARAEPNDVISTYAALRPLAERLGIPEASVSRRERIIQDAPGLVTLIGGKLTTYRSVAQRVVRRALRDLQTPAEGVKRPTSASVLQEGMDRAMREGEELGLGRETLDQLATAAGPEMPGLLAILEDRSLRDPVLPGLPYVRGQVAYAVRHEMALRLEDVLARRLRVMNEDPEHGLGVADEVAELMGPYLGWDAPRIASEVERYRAMVGANEGFREE
ncbi:MAG: glycerol-3-phosphate dehydrogenase/oxidase [Candidatus Thermoplasmatota archaeon]|nr:glycerol-3-phosphate dehydrogenase/oxidase [Candidatus Thermoplasmatota archaeon]